MSRYIDEHRGRFGVEPICRTLDVSASAYYQRASGKRFERVMEDERLLARIFEVHAARQRPPAAAGTSVADDRELDDQPQPLRPLAT